MSQSSSHTQLNSRPSTRELGKQRLVVLGKIRAAKLRKDRVQGIGQLLHSKQNIAEETLQDVRTGGVDSLEREAHNVVVFEQGLGIEDTTSEIGDVDAGEGVGLAGVATDDGHVGKSLECAYSIECEGCDSVVITDGASVPLR